MLVSEWVLHSYLLYCRQELKQMLSSGFAIPFVLLHIKVYDIKQYSLNKDELNVKSVCAAALLTVRLLTVPAEFTYFVIHQTSCLLDNILLS